MLICHYLFNYIHSSQNVNPFFRWRMGHKQFCQPISSLVAFKRRINVEMRCGFIYSLKRNLTIGNFFQRRSQPFRITSQKRAGSISQKFSLSGNGQLDEFSDNRSKNSQNNSNEHHYELGLPATFSVISSASEKMRPQKKVGHKRHKSDENYNNRGNKNIFVANMGKLVGDDSFQFIFVKNLPQAGSYRDSRVFLIPTSGESVGRRVVYRINFRYFEPGCDAKIFHYSVKLQILLSLYRPRARHRQDDFVRKPVAEEIHKQAENNGDNDKRRVAVNLREHPANADDNDQKHAHQKPCLADIF